MTDEMKSMLNDDRNNLTLMINKGRTVLKIFRSEEDYNPEDTYGYDEKFGDVYNADVEQIIEIAIETLLKELKK